MTRIAAIKSPYNYNASLIGELKQLLLLFDLIGIPALGKLIEHLDSIKLSEDGVYLRNEIEFLRSNNLLFDSMPANSVELKDNIDPFLLSKEFRELASVMERASNLEEKAEAGSRISALIMNNEKTTRDFHSIPLVKLIKLPSIQATQHEVYKLLIDQMPIPNDQTPWESILEYRADSDSAGQLAGLRVWINDLIRSGKNISEINDELEHRLYLYRRSLEAHRIKHSSGILQTIVVGGAELAENLIKLKFSNIARGLFSIQQSQVDLIHAELSSPGNEIAYIYNAKQSFN